MIIPLWLEFYMAHVFNHRQNTTTLWGSQEKWVEILEEWISTEFSDSEKETTIKLLRDMDPEVRIRVLYKLKEKEYYDEIYEMAKFEGWV